MRIRVGTSGYNFPEWKGPFYPEKLPAAKMLRLLRTVGDGRDQLHVLTACLTRRPSPLGRHGAGGFSFVLKARRRSRTSSDSRKSKNELKYFCDTAAGLGAKLGPLLFQLPPNFKKGRRAPAPDAGAHSVGDPPRLGVPQRSWFDDEVYQLRATECGAGGGRHGGGDHARSRDGGLGISAAARRRLRRRGSQALGRARQDARRRWEDTYVFFKHEEAGLGPAFAKQFVSLFS